MELNTNNSIVYQQLSQNKYNSLSADKVNKSSFEKNDVVDTSGNNNPQKSDVVKRVENQISSMPSLNNANEELTKSSNLNKLLLQSMAM